MGDQRCESEPLLPKSMTSTPMNSPETSSDHFENALKSALDVISGCIKSTEDLNKVCVSYREQEGSAIPPELKKIIDRIIEDNKAVANLKTKISKVTESVKSDNFESLKREFASIMNSMESISSEKVKMFADLLCHTETSYVRKRFVQSEKELNKIDPSLLPDEKTRKFGLLLLERNRKVINCLDYFSALLPKLPEISKGGYLNLIPRCTAATQNCSKPPRKLFILGENLQSRLTDLEGEDKVIGNVVIEAGESEKSQSPSLTNCDHRQMLCGFMEKENGDLEEVRLELIEPTGDLINCLNGSHSDSRPLTARIEIDGQPVEHSLTVVEIDLLDDDSSNEAAKVIAIVENNETGKPEEVELSLVPTSKQIHGKILEFQSSNSRSKLPVRNYRTKNLPRKPPKTAKQVFKDIARIVHTLSAMGADAVTSEASRNVQQRQIPAIFVDRSPQTPQAGRRRSLAQALPMLTYDSFLASGSKITSSARKPLPGNYQTPPASKFGDRFANLGNRNLLALPSHKNVNFDSVPPYASSTPIQEGLTTRRERIWPVNKLDISSILLTPTRPSIRTKLRDRLSLPSTRPFEEPRARKINVDPAQESDEPVKFIPPSKFTHRVPSRIPESLPSAEDFARMSFSPKSPSYFDDIGSQYTHGNVSQYEKLNGVLEQISPEKLAEAISIVILSMKQPATANRSLPANLEKLRTVVTSVADDPSLNTYYRKNQQHWNATHDVLSESMKEMKKEEERIEAEEQSQAQQSHYEAVKQKEVSRLASQGLDDYEALSAEDFASRFADEVMKLGDVSLELVDESAEAESGSVSSDDDAIEI